MAESRHGPQTVDEISYAELSFERRSDITDNRFCWSPFAQLQICSPQQQRQPASPPTRTMSTAIQRTTHYLRYDKHTPRRTLTLLHPATLARLWKNERYQVYTDYGATNGEKC